MEELNRTILHNILPVPSPAPLSSAQHSGHCLPAWYTLSDTVRMLRSVAALHRDTSDA